MTIRLTPATLEFCQWWQPRAKHSRAVARAIAAGIAPRQIEFWLWLADRLAETSPQRTSQISPPDLPMGQGREFRARAKVSGNDGLAGTGTNSNGPGPSGHLGGVGGPVYLTTGVLGDLLAFRGSDYVRLTEADLREVSLPDMLTDLRARRAQLDVWSDGDQGVLAEQHVKAGKKRQRDETGQHDGDVVVAHDGLVPGDRVGHVGRDGAQDTESQRRDR